MRVRLPGSYFCIAGLVTTLAASGLTAQGAPAPRFGLGATGMLAGITSGSSGFVGAEGFMRLGDDPIFRTRIDGALYGAVGSLSAVGCTLSSNDGCDQRQIGGLATVMATALIGPRASSGLRPFYLLAGAGVGVTTLSGAAYYADNRPVRHALDMGPTVFVAQGGFGSESDGFRIELRLLISEPATSYRTSAYTVEQPGGGINLTLGHVW
jgi:hypothetical protein